MSQMTREDAIKEAVKVAAAFKLLQSGRLTMMDEDEFKAFKEWLN